MQDLAFIVLYLALNIGIPVLLLVALLKKKNSSSPKGNTMSKTITIKVRIAEITLALAEATGNGVSRLQSGLNRVLNKATDRLNDCINARIEFIGDCLIAQAHAENNKPFDRANKVSAQIAKLNGAKDTLFSEHLKETAKLGERRASYLTDEELAKAREKSTALLVKRRELLNRKRYF